MGATVIANASYIRESAPVEILSSGGRLTARITCDACGAHEVWAINGRAPPPEQLPSHFKKRGWVIRNRTTCPICAVKTKEKPMTKTATITPIAAPIAAPVTADAAKKNKRAVIIALEDYFDEAARQYRSGKSDQAVADELKLAPAFVASVREEFYGKMAAPTEIQAIRSEVADMEDSIAAMKARLDRLCSLNNWA